LAAPIAIPPESSDDSFAIYQTRSKNKPFKFFRGTHQRSLPPYRGDAPSVIRFFVLKLILRSTKKSSKTSGETHRIC
jgi:hypothetical protein